MVPIEQVSHGTLIFLACGCAARRGITHPTGAAALIEIVQPCAEHRQDHARFRAVARGEEVHLWVRHPAQLEPLRAR